MKKITRFRPRVKSRHKTHSCLRTKLPLLPFRSVVRLGSKTGVVGNFVECNSAEACMTSAHKGRMKAAFIGAGVITAEYHRATDALRINFPVVAKHNYGSRGTGNYLIKTQGEFNGFLNNHNKEDFIIEKFHDFGREYRLHVTSEGCLYACRKMLRNGVDKGKRWARHADNCVWIVEENPRFDKPANWDKIVAESVKALKAVGLDIGAIDVKVQSAKDKHGDRRQAPDFIILETNSAPSFGARTEKHYLEEIPKILNRKHELNKRHQGRI